jgi:hypothetical protein
MDHQQFDFKNIQLTGMQDAQGDTAFDTEPLPPVTPSTGLASLKVVQA